VADAQALPQLAGLTEQAVRQGAHLGFCGPYPFLEAFALLALKAWLMRPADLPYWVVGWHFFGQSQSAQHPAVANGARRGR